MHDEELTYEEVLFDEEEIMEEEVIDEPKKRGFFGALRRKDSIHKPSDDEASEKTEKKKGRGLRNPVLESPS